MLHVSRKALLDRLEIAARIAEKKTPKEVLKWARIAFDGSELTVTATDHEVGVRLKVRQNDPITGERGVFLVPAAHTVAVLKSFTSDPLKIDPQDGGTTLIGNREQFRLPAMDAAEFPEWKHDGESVQIRGKSFTDAVQRVAWSCDTETTRYNLGGLHLVCGPSSRVEATDSRTAAIEPIETVGEVADWDGIIQAPAATLAANILRGDFQASLGKSSVEMSDVDSLVYARRIDGKFPHLNDAIPKQFEAEFDISVGELLRAVRQVALATDKEAMSVNLDLADGELVMTSRSDVKGNADVRIPVPCSESCSSRVDVTFLQRMLAVLDPLEAIHWGMNDEQAHLFTFRNWRALVSPQARDAA